MRATAKRNAQQIEELTAKVAELTEKIEALTAPTAPTELSAIVEETNQGPFIGDIVLYTLTAEDAESIYKRREAKEQHLHAAAQHQLATECGGNGISEGHSFPMIVTAVWGPDCVNGRLLLDGHDDPLWLCSRDRSDEPQPGHWHR